MKNYSCSGACVALNWIICLLFFLVTVISLVGVYRTHFGLNGMMFGSSNGSFALLAFVAALTMWSKTMCRCLCSKE
ncbi:MAG: hypothetical protein PHX87_05205 [Candidatus Peribacteraceae bacterium]|nr:hypothetical protein [Candidatus Peribacteraceae bacterium]MDD5742793.1 hypothetical protein [Candidatus Peribacteraceae bacterium]